MRRRAHAVLGLVVAGALIASGCDDDASSVTVDTSSSTGDTSSGSAATAPDASTADTSDPSSQAIGAAALLREIPSSIVASGSPVEVWYSNLARVSALLGLERPEPNASDDAARDWFLALDGIRRDEGERSLVSALMPSSLMTELGQNAAIRDELGWSVVEVDEFVESVTPPNRFFVASGPTAASLGAVIGEPTDGVWRIGEGEDFAPNVTESSPARQLGVPLNEAFARDLLVMAPSTAATREWLARPAPSFADQPSLAAIAKAFDAAEVYAGQIVQFEEPPQDGDVNPFVAVGVGLTTDAGDPVALLAYSYADAGTAQAGAAAVEELARTGNSSLTGAPWSDMFSVEGVEVDGTTAVLRLRPVADRPLAFVWQLIPARESLTSRG